MQLAGDYTALCTVKNVTTTTHVNTVNFDALPALLKKNCIADLHQYELYVKTADGVDVPRTDAHIYNILDTGGIRDTRPESQQVYSGYKLYTYFCTRTKTY